MGNVQMLFLTYLANKYTKYVLEKCMKKWEKFENIINYTYNNYAKYIKMLSWVDKNSYINIKIIK